jgi:hypothetical protein
MMMSRLLTMLAVAAAVAAVQPAAAAPAIADDDAGMGVLQQGKGQGGGQGGGGQEARGNRGQGGGSQARESGRGRSGGGEARQGGSGGGTGQGSARRSESSGGNSGSARNDDRGRGRSSDDARESRGNSGGNANARGEDRSSNAGATGTARRGGGSSADLDRLRGRSAPRDLQSRLNALPAAQRRMAGSSRVSERLAAGAIARGHARGLAADAFDVRSDNDRVRILNRRGDLLFDLDDRRAADLGGWPLRRLGDQSPRANAPAFCRNGQGHPVWGREWCYEKGFGLGSRQGTVWSRGGIGDVIFRNPDYRTRLDRGGLIGVLGDIVLGRLALQSVALGYSDPLTGYWVADPSGPYVLRVQSGPYEVAEFYDSDRDNNADVLYVVQPVW